MKAFLPTLIILFSITASAKDSRTEYQKFTENFRPSPEQIAAQKCERRGGIWNSFGWGCVSAGWPSGSTVVDEKQCLSGSAQWVSGHGYQCL